MDIETAIQAFASAGNDLPQEAAEWALDHWEEAAPGLLGVLERFASGTERSDEAASAVFFILHLRQPLARGSRNSWLRPGSGALVTLRGESIGTLTRNGGW